MRTEVGSVGKTLRGLLTVAHRRGFGYFGYLLGGVAWPGAAYRFLWGPSAPALLQGVFAAAGEFAARTVDFAELRRLELLGDAESPRVKDVDPSELEQLMDRAHAAGVTGVSHGFTDLVRTRFGRLAFADLGKA